MALLFDWGVVKVLTLGIRNTRMIRDILHSVICAGFAMGNVMREWGLLLGHFTGSLGKRSYHSEQRGNV